MLVFFKICDILFSVMRDMISCEEVFEADANARAEFEAVCSAWQDEVIAAQEAAGHETRVVDLTQVDPNGDYSVLLEEIFEADSVQVW